MKLGLIGCGKMGGAIFQGIVQQGTLSTDQLFLMSKSKSSADALQERLGGGHICADTAELVANCDAIMVGVKPNEIQSVLATCEHEWAGKLIISIAAGVQSETIRKATKGKARVIRVMPNTPSLIGEGASAFCSELATKEDADFVEKVFSSIGTVSHVKESQMDAVTGLSGSGPAYVYMIIEALSDAGVKQGLPRDEALKLATQTVKGAALMVEKTGEHPAQLKENVTSPGGTTIAGVAKLEERNLRHALIEAVATATNRSKELA